VNKTYYEIFFHKQCSTLVKMFEVYFLKPFFISLMLDGLKIDNFLEL